MNRGRPSNHSSSGTRRPSRRAATLIASRPARNGSPQAIALAQLLERPARPAPAPPARGMNSAVGEPLAAPARCGARRAGSRPAGAPPAPAAAVAPGRSAGAGEQRREPVGDAGPGEPGLLAGKRRPVAEDRDDARRTIWAPGGSARSTNARSSGPGCSSTSVAAADRAARAGRTSCPRAARGTTPPGTPGPSAAPAASPASVSTSNRSPARAAGAAAPGAVQRVQREVRSAPRRRDRV